jgi:hypothetical protein
LVLKKSIFQQEGVMRIKHICLLMVVASLAVTMAVAATAGLVEIGHLKGSKGSYGGVVVRGEYAYCVGPSFDVVNIEDPTNPWVEASIDGVDGRDIFLYDDYAYVACARFGSNPENIFLRIIDISNPTNPATVGSLAVNCPNAVSVAFPYALFTSGDLEIVDVHDPFNPMLVGKVDWSTGEDVYSVSPPTSPYVYSTRVYWGGGDLGIVDISDPFNPTVVGSLFIFPCPHGIDCEGSYAYVAACSGGGSDEGLVVIDISNPTRPEEVARCSASFALHVAVHRGYAYLTRCHKFSLIDVHDPEHPLLEQTFYSPDPWGIDVDSNNYAYLGDRKHGLSIIGLVEAPAVTVSLTPEATTFEQGDTLTCEVTLINMTNKDQIFGFETRVRLPNGADVMLIKRTKVFLPPQGVKTGRIRHLIPSDAPTGNDYIYFAKVGATPMDIWDEDRFPFEVIDSR